MTAVGAPSFSFSYLERQVRSTSSSSANAAWLRLPLA